MVVISQHFFFLKRPCDWNQVSLKNDWINESKLKLECEAILYKFLLDRKTADINQGGSASL